MKAIILERRGDYAAALREDGVVVKIRQAGQVGETVELGAEVLEFPRAGRRWVKTGIAAALAVVILGGSFGYLSGTASAYVSLDVGDASIELSVNHLGRVLSVNALREGDRDFVRELDRQVRGRRVDEALDRTLTAFSDGGYLETADTAIIAGVTSGSAERSAELAASVEDAVTRAGAEGPHYTFSLSPQERGRARENDLSGGRYAYEQAGLPNPRPDGHGAAAPQVTESPSPTPPPSPTAIPAAQLSPSPVPADGRETQPTQPPAPSDTPADRLAEQPAPSNNPADQPAQQPAPSDNPADRPAEQPAPSDNPTNRPAEQPAPSDNPTNRPAEQPAPSDNPAEPPIRQPDRQDTPDLAARPTEQDTPPAPDSPPDSGKAPGGTEPSGGPAPDGGGPGGGPGGGHP